MVNGQTRGKSGGDDSRVLDPSSLLASFGLVVYLRFR